MPRMGSNHFRKHTRVKPLNDSVYTDMQATHTTGSRYEAQKEGKSDSELDEMWWKQAGELVANYYKQREEVEKDVEGVVWNTGEILGGCVFGGTIEHHLVLDPKPWSFLGFHPYPVLYILLRCSVKVAKRSSFENSWRGEVYLFIYFCYLFIYPSIYLTNLTSYLTSYLPIYLHTYTHTHTRIYIYILLYYIILYYIILYYIILYYIIFYYIKYAYIHTCTHTYTYTIHIHIYTHTHTHTHFINCLYNQ